ncbi:MAG: hypothetical protein A4S08_11520 [Proteobacteria bacterium SG_bin4]|nr:MAG: hypothetical protein A4S08_11520 [Proteobacteria bacterium SG_bin4]
MISFLFSHKHRLGILGLSMFLAGCNSLIGDKLNISEKLPNQLVISKLETLLSDKNLDAEKLFDAQDNEGFKQCMAPLLHESIQIDKGKLPLIPILFKGLGAFPQKNTLLGFSPDMFKKEESINIDNLGNIINNLSKKRNPIHLTSIFDDFLNFKHINNNPTDNKQNQAEGEEKIEQLKEILRLYSEAYFSPSFESIASTSISNSDSKKPGFIARDGTKYSFSGLNKSEGKLSIDHNQIGADMVRIFLEAVRDTFYPLPVDADSTLAQAQNEKKLKFKIDIFNKPNDNNEITWKAGKKEYKYNMDVDYFRKIETNANTSEATIATAIGKAIRGGSMGSLNNEAIAKTIETAAGVVARHTTERFEWCLAVNQEEVTSKQKVSEVHPILLTGY